MVRPSYWPTPMAVVEQMLDVAKLRAGESFCDLGSGDGRFVGAAQARGAIACGVERDAELVRKSMALGLDIREGDLMDCDLSPFDVVTGFFESADAETVTAKFDREAKPGARLVLRVHSEIVCHSRAS